MVGVDRNARAPDEANRIAIDDTVACLNSFDVFPDAHCQLLTRDYKSLDAVKDLYKSQPTFSNIGTAIVVEVTTRYVCTRGNDTYEVACELNVDIPVPMESKPDKSKPDKSKSDKSKPKKSKNEPEDRSQKEPHFGWQVKLNGTREGNGHVFLPKEVLKAGRPEMGLKLEKYSFEGRVLQGLGNDWQMERKCSFRRYK